MSIKISKNQTKNKKIILGKEALAEKTSNSLKKKGIKINKPDIEQVIEGMLEEIKNALVKGEEVRFLGYYSLSTTIQKPRVAMNLQTKKKMNIPAKRVPKAKFSAIFKEAKGRNQLKKR